MAEQVKMIGLREAVEMTGLSYFTLRRMCLDDKIHHIRVGTGKAGKIMMSQESLSKALGTKSIPAPEEEKAKEGRKRYVETEAIDGTLSVKITDEIVSARIRKYCKKVRMSKMDFIILCCTEYLNAHENEWWLNMSEEQIIKYAEKQEEENMELKLKLRELERKLEDKKD